MKSSLWATALATTLIAACAPASPNATGLPGDTGATLQAKSLIPVGSVPQGIAYSQGFVYVSNNGAGTISVIDAATDAKTADLAIGGKPAYMSASPDGRIVANVDRTGKVRLIDPAGGQHRIVQTLEVGKVPCHVRFSADGKQLGVTLTEESLVKVYTFADGYDKAPAVASFPVGTVAGPASTAMGGGMAGMPAMAGMASMKMRGLAFASGFLLVPNTGENNASLVNLATAEVKTIPGGNDPAVVGLAEAGTVRRAIIGNTASNTAIIYDLAGGESKTLSVGQSPADVLSSPDGKTAFITNGGTNDLSVIDLATAKELKRVPVGRRPGALYWDNGRIWVLNNDGASATIMDAASYRVLASVGIGKGKHQAAFGPTKAYLSNTDSNDVSVVDLAAIK